jgi:hypothetical protein
MRIFLTAAVFTLLTASSTIGEPMKDGDRQRLLAHLSMTEDWLTSELEGLSAEQVKYRMTPDSWSIMDVVEHSGSS